MSNKRLRLTTKQKIEILDEKARGVYSQSELGDWAKQRFGLDKALSQQTISNIVKKSEELYNTINLVENTKSLKLPMYPQLDDEVKTYVNRMAEANLPVNRASIIRYIKHISQVKYNIPEGTIAFSDGWLTKVFKRIGVKSRPTHGESASVDVTSNSIQRQLRKIEELLEQYDPADILNFDETGLYYQQPPRRTISSMPLGGLKKSKTRLTVGLLCNSDGTYKGHPIVIGKYKSPKCFKTNSRLLALTATGRKHYVEYHHSPNAWMTEKIFTSYVLKLDRAFGREGRKVALLLDNASVHNTKITLDNIKLIFLPANTTSKLQALDAGKGLLLHLLHFFSPNFLSWFKGIIANFKAYFRALQYDRALNMYMGNNLSNPNVYHMDQVEAMFFLANAWLKIRPETIKNCWRHTRILDFKENPVLDGEVEYPTTSLPLEEDVTTELNEMLPNLPGNTNNEVTDISQLDLETDESEISNDAVEEIVESNENEDAAQEEEPDINDAEPIDIKECKKKLREAYEAILKYEVPLDDLDRQIHKHVRRRLAESRAEVIAEREQKKLAHFLSTE
jgi:hypothetical protein